MLDLAALENLRSQTGLSRVTLEICARRGLETPESIERFLNPKLEELTPPFKIRDLERAAHRLADARERGELVWIFGDYDVDGTTGTALLSWFFRSLGMAFQARQPDRFRDGYGLNVGAVEEAAAAGARVLVTVDCGITSFAPIARARELGLDLIVVDHHQIDATRGLPEGAFAIVNPQRIDCESGLKQLCGCGLAFYLALGVRSVGRARGWFSPQFLEPNLKQHLDLVVVGTAADMVPLVGDNHILVKQGLEVLRHTQKPGLRRLLEAAGVAAKLVSPSHLGFTLGPRINASGRMGSASLALDLLTTQDEERAAELAARLEAVNAERMQVQNAIWDEVRVRVEQGIAQGRFADAVVVCSPDWHEGVVGIVASRVVDAFKRPAIVMAERDGHAKGSVRSYGGQNVLGALRACAGLLKTFGGHAHAAGLGLDPANVSELETQFQTALRELRQSAAPVDGGDTRVDVVCGLEELDLKTLREIERLGPFGPGNPEPRVQIEARLSSRRVLKERHLKLLFEGMNEDQVRVEGIWFGAAESTDRLEEIQAMIASRQTANWIVIPEINRFRGELNPSLRVRDRLTH